jgi:hypothetical protein
MNINYSLLHYYKKILSINNKKLLLNILQNQ